ncbi:hypothetical protein D3C76_1668710 [compost metagenome]
MHDRQQVRRDIEHQRSEQEGPTASDGIGLARVQRGTAALTGVRAVAQVAGLATAVTQAQAQVLGLRGRVHTCSHRSRMSRPAI